MRLVSHYALLLAGPAPLHQLREGSAVLEVAAWAERPHPPSSDPDSSIVSLILDGEVMIWSGFDIDPFPQHYSQ